MFWQRIVLVSDVTIIRTCDSLCSCASDTSARSRFQERIQLVLSYCIAIRVHHDITDWTQLHGISLQAAEIAFMQKLKGVEFFYVDHFSSKSLESLVCFCSDYFLDRIEADTILKAEIVFDFCVHLFRPHF